MRSYALAAAVFGVAITLIRPGVCPADTLPMSDAFAVEDIVHAQVPYYEDLDVNFQGEGSFAVAFWRPAHGHPAGAMLVKKSGGNWELVKVVHPIFKDASSLEALGVPPAQAKALVLDIQNTAQ